MATGWRFKKRPGIDHFLRAIGPPMFEVVIYTKESGMVGTCVGALFLVENWA
ncbi:hypothetical protein DPMN_094468 [Dreissena polymorpha]|uniref:FCP1 homology domain-containing protein n=1 Tax=Dreissena polymorpha TaxID=45954 RepID=A0A9D4L635_DREPO|nr:hypothetical protein DPMN_094468 [Dreissena polymorpha]